MSYYPASSIRTGAAAFFCVYFSSFLAEQLENHVGRCDSAIWNQANAHVAPVRWMCAVKFFY